MTSLSISPRGGEASIYSEKFLKLLHFGNCVAGSSQYVSCTNSRATGNTVCLFPSLHTLWDVVNNALAINVHSPLQQNKDGH